MRGGLLLATVPLACLALAGCSSTGPLQGPGQTVASHTPPAAPDGKVDDVTRGILMAAGLDPADPAKPREIRRQVAAVVQVRYRGRTYGTALARPTPGKIAFVDPTAVANLLAGARSKTELARALRGPLIDVDSQDCRFDGRSARKVRKAFKLPKVCPEAAGSVWADLDRRAMAVEVHLSPELAALVQESPALTTALAAPTLFAPQDDPKTAARAAVNLLSPNLVAAVAQPEPPPAAAPISLSAPVVLPPLADPTAGASVATQEAPPWSSLMAPAASASQPKGDREAAPAVLTTPAERAAPAMPAAIEANAGALQPQALSRSPVVETEDSYMPQISGGYARVVSDSYRPATATTKLFQTKY
jgi:hypothetical protein